MSYKKIMRKYHNVIYPEDIEPKPMYESVPQPNQVFCWDDTGQSPITGYLDTRTKEQKKDDYKRYLEQKRNLQRRR